MSHACSLWNGMARRSTSVAGLAAACALGFVATIAPAAAQDKKAPAKEAAPATGALPAGKDAGKDAKDAKAPQGKQTAWVKLCEKAAFNTKDKEGKEVKNEKDICLTHHERLDGNSGMVLVSAAIREVAGNDKQHLMIMVPLGMAIPAGVRAAVYTKEQWAAAAKNEKIDEKTLKPVELKYSLCHPAGCTAEVETTPELLEQMKTGGGLMVLAMNAAAQPVGFPVPLDGFTEAQTGKPVDNKEYAKARGQLMGQIRQRQQELAATFKKEKEELLKNSPDGKVPAPKGPDTKAADAKAAPAAKGTAPAEKK